MINKCNQIDIFISIETECKREGKKHTHTKQTILEKE